MNPMINTRNWTGQQGSVNGLDQRSICISISVNGLDQRSICICISVKTGCFAQLLGMMMYCYAA